jgi:hypothetical protein
MVVLFESRAESRLDQGALAEIEDFAAILWKPETEPLRRSSHSNQFAREK